MTDIVKYKALAVSKGLARVLLRLDGRDALDGRELGDELLLRRVVGGLPGVVVGAGLCAESTSESHAIEQNLAIDFYAARDG